MDSALYKIYDDDDVVHCVILCEETVHCGDARCIMVASRGKVFEFFFNKLFFLFKLK